MLRVGMTYDLRDDYLAQGHGPEETAEFDKEETIAAIESALRRNGYAPQRIGNVRALAARLVAGDRWDLVFNIAEGMYGIGREAQVPALLDAWNIPYVFSDTVVLGLCLDKGLTKRVVRDCGVPTAPFAVVREAGDVAAIDLPFPLFAKPIAEGTGKGVHPTSRVTDRAALAAVCARLLAQHRQPVLVESYLPGREFTVGIVGSGAAARVVAVMEVLLNASAEDGVYSYLNKEEWTTRVTYRLATDAEAAEAGRVALAGWRALGCRDGGRVDVRSDAAGQPNFIEVNPLAGLCPGHSDLPILAAMVGVGYDDLIGEIMASAVARLGLPVPVAELAG